MRARAFMLLALALGGCSAEDIVVATLEGDDAAMADASGPRDAAAMEASLGDAAVWPGGGCRDSFDCEDDTYFCSKMACDAPRGVCVRRPQSCDGELNPVCGCDGITYANDCLRRQRGVRYAEREACRFDGERAQRCGGRRNVPCPPDTYCAKLLNAPQFCMPDAPGVCWMLGECDGRRPERYRPCAPDEPPACFDTCTAIRSQRVHFRLDCVRP